MLTQLPHTHSCSLLFHLHTLEAFTLAASKALPLGSTIAALQWARLAVPECTGIVITYVGRGLGVWKAWHLHMKCSRKSCQLVLASRSLLIKQISCHLVLAPRYCAHTSLVVWQSWLPVLASSYQAWHNMHSTEQSISQHRAASHTTMCKHGHVCIGFRQVIVSSLHQPPWLLLHTSM